MRHLEIIHDFVALEMFNRIYELIPLFHYRKARAVVESQEQADAQGQGNYDGERGSKIAGGLSGQKQNGE